jgi:predicted dinucleotide-binding enzyme
VNIAFIGYGHVGAPLADHLERLGHTVTLAVNNEESENARKVHARNARLRLAPIAQAIKHADVVFLATPFQANEAVLKGVADDLAGKILVDCTNPVGPGLTHGLMSVRSGSEMVQAFAPRAHVVKAFSIYGYENFEDNRFPDYRVKPAMLFCGNDIVSKSVVTRLIEQLGWEPIDVGGLEQALHLEHLTLLWVRYVRLSDVSPNFVWAALRK